MLTRSRITQKEQQMNKSFTSSAKLKSALTAEWSIVLEYSQNNAICKCRWWTDRGNGNLNSLVEMLASTVNSPRKVDLVMHLSKIVKIVFAINPAKRRSFVDAISFVDDVTDVSTFAVVESTFE